MIVVRKFFMSLLWFVVFLLISLGILVIMVISGVDMAAPDAQAAAEAMGAELGEKYGLLAFGGSAVLAVIGSIAGILPGSRHASRGDGSSGAGMMVFRKIAMSVIWFLVLYFGILIVGGMIMGGIAGANAPPGDISTATEAGAAAGEAFALEYGNFILFGSLAVAVLGSIFGLLPFTKHNKG